MTIPQFGRLPHNPDLQTGYRKDVEVLECQGLAGGPWNVRVSARLQPTGYMQPRMAVNAAQHKIVNSLKKHYEIFLCDYV